MCRATTHRGTSREILRFLFVQSDRRARGCAGGWGGKKRGTGKRRQLEEGSDNPRRVYERRAAAVFSRGGKEYRVDKRESARKRQCGVPCVNIHPTGVSACASGNHRRLNHRRCRRRRRKSSRSYESTWSTRLLATKKEEKRRRLTRNLGGRRGRGQTYENIVTGQPTRGPWCLTRV